MKKKFILVTLIFSSFLAMPALSEDIPVDPTLLYNQLLNQTQNTSPQDLEKVTSDPDLAALMEVLKMVRNKSYKEAIPVLEDLVKNSKGNNLTSQSKEMIKSLIDVMKVMNSEYSDINP
jgi:hypothetical protein